ncbi:MULTISPECIES: DUF4232 domain-containing protein [Streptomyces]|uniref:DUF4232 domain-containing protein n=1 Tax=Streptomyces dengpaensis TaxID=2049881 RepID=A0ABM6SRN4_9ACTN|nr:MULTISPECIES: DUF4232 domain-containing protein [Streptomyces]AVH57345.1 DUF4232 domain-containing protein [Streptomyces dengpaensis]PIB05359.1 hypothetical protein B1C81_28965 [Streptomyces sp. HG99]
MRVLPIAVAVLAGAFALTSCGDSGGGGDAHAASTSASANASASTDCKIDEVGIQVGPANAAQAAGDTGNVPVTITNPGTQCTLEGFPGLEVRAGETSTEILPDKSAQPVKLPLAKDGAASFTITYVRGEGGDAKTLDLKTLKISLPGSDKTQDFAWSFGPVAGKDGAGTLNASTSPFQHAGD